jgi:multisubunit Na+/H+ antiporter MnhG subunit
MISRLLEALSPHRAPDLLERHRAETIRRRVGSIAPLFAVLTLAWTAVDAVAFDRATLERLVLLRLAAAAAFASLALGSRRSRSRSTPSCRSCSPRASPPSR